jgi:hypothetical protein
MKSLNTGYHQKLKCLYNCKVGDVIVWQSPNGGRIFDYPVVGFHIPSFGSKPSPHYMPVVRIRDDEVYIYIGHISYIVKIKKLSK